MTYGAFAAPYNYGGVQKSVQVTGWYCGACDESILEGDALQKVFLAAAALKAEVEKVLAPAEVARIRSALGLSQRKAGEILGGGPRAFQKYEAGKQTPGVPMSHLLRVLEKHPTVLKEILPRQAVNSAVAKALSGEKQAPSKKAPRKKPSRRMRSVSPD